MSTEPNIAAPRGAARPGEAGSAYMAVLLVLVVLTIFGLALTLITQTERQIGNNERTLARVFYAANAGVEVATAKALVTSDYSSQTFSYNDIGPTLTTGELAIGTNVQTSAFLPVQDVPCNLCEINNVDGSGTYADRSYSKVNHIVTVRAQRFATVDGGTTLTPVAQETLTAMVEVQPFKSPPAALKILENAAGLELIKP